MHYLVVLQFLDKMMSNNMLIIKFMIFLALYYDF